MGKRQSQATNWQRFLRPFSSKRQKGDEFALNNVKYLLIGIGIAAKMFEVIIVGFNMPLSFYTDMALDVFFIKG